MISGTESTEKHYQECELCKGSGDCPDCEGSGENELGGVCDQCGGDCVCPDCGGEAGYWCLK